MEGPCFLVADSAGDLVEAATDVYAAADPEANSQNARSCKLPACNRMLQLTESPCMRKLASVEDAYQLCRQITAKYSKTFIWARC